MVGIAREKQNIKVCEYHCGFCGITYWREDKKDCSNWYVCPEAGCFKKVFLNETSISLIVEKKDE